MARLLIVHAAGEGQTAIIGDALARQRRARGHAVTTASLTGRESAPAPEGFAGARSALAERGGSAKE